MIPTEFKLANARIVATKHSRLQIELILFINGSIVKEFLNLPNTLYSDLLNFSIIYIVKYLVYAKTIPAIQKVEEHTQLWTNTLCNNLLPSYLKPFYPKPSILQIFLINFSKFLLPCHCLGTKFDKVKSFFVPQLFLQETASEFYLLL